MISRNRNRALVGLLLLLNSLMVAAQQNGMYADHRNNYLIPLQEQNAVVGHAYVMLADKISRDSNSYVIGVYDPFLINVGERKVNMPNAFVFDCASFDGKDLYTRFIDEGRAIRYLVFSQNAALLFDTTLALNCKKTPPNAVAYYQQAAIRPVAGNGIVDNVLLAGNRAPGAATVRLFANHTLWINENVASKNAANQVLFANDNTVVEVVYQYQKANGVTPALAQTRIVALNGATGKAGTEFLLAAPPAEHIYPVNASVTGGMVEVISEYTHQPSKYGRIKYGICLHRLSLTGNAPPEVVTNELTTTLPTDPSLKKGGRQLVTNSYLHLSHAAHLSDGNWVIALQQFSKKPQKVRLIRNPKVSYEMRSLAFATVSKDAKLHNLYLESNGVNEVELPARFFKYPQYSGTYLQTTNAADVAYYVSPGPESNQVSFVFADADANHKLIIGNVRYQNGAFTTDKFTHPESGSFTLAGLLPARFGHTYMISYNIATGRFNFDNIRFMN
jgi:hypothetical protein